MVAACMSVGPGGAKGRQKCSRASEDVELLLLLQSGASRRRNLRSAAIRAQQLNARTGHTIEVGHCLAGGAADHVRRHACGAAWLLTGRHSGCRSGRVRPQQLFCHLGRQPIHPALARSRDDASALNSPL